MKVLGLDAWHLGPADVESKSRFRGWGAGKGGVG